MCESERAENKGGALMIDDLIQKDIRFRPYNAIESSYLAQQDYHSAGLIEKWFVLQIAAVVTCLS